MILHVYPWDEEESYLISSSGADYSEESIDNRYFYLDSNLCLFWGTMRQVLHKCRIRVVYLPIKLKMYVAETP